MLTVQIFQQDIWTGLKEPIGQAGKRVTVTAGILPGKIN